MLIKRLEERKRSINIKRVGLAKSSFVTKLVDVYKSRIKYANKEEKL